MTKYEEPQFMNPKVDFAFKLLFGNPKHPEICISLLNAVLQLPEKEKIIEVEFKNPNLLQRFSSDKYSILDIRALANNNIHINIEMQILNRNDMIERSIHYLSRMVSDQLKSGQKYCNLQQTICINFVDFQFLTNEFVHNKYNYRNEKNEVLTNLTEIHFIELPKVAKGGIINDNMLKRWISFINDPTSKEVEMLIGQYTEMKEAKKILFFSNLKQKLKDYYFERERCRLEKNSLLDEATRYGLEKGLKEGLEKGIKKQAIDSAKKMLAKNFNVQLISEMTGLSENEINELK